MATMGTHTFILKSVIDTWDSGYMGWQLPCDKYVYILLQTFSIDSYLCKLFKFNIFL